MIVVDSNVIAYCWLNTAQTPRAQAVRLKDDDWHVPLLWRSEMRSILAGYMRNGSLTAKQAGQVMARVEQELEGNEHLVESADVLALVGSSTLSAYDCELVALAQALGALLVTEDRAVLKARPKDAVSMAVYARKGHRLARVKPL